MAEALAFPALADANRITMENHSLSQNTYFNKILLLFIASGQLSSPPAALRTPPSQPQLLAPAAQHCSTSAETSLQFSLYVPPPTFALCLLCFQKSKYSLFSAPPGCCERLVHCTRGFSLLKRFFFIIISSFEGAGYHSLLTSSE